MKKIILAYMIGQRIGVLHGTEEYIMDKKIW